MKIESVYNAFDEEARRKKCEATVGLLAEGDEIAADYQGSPVINAALISAAQKVEHYEIASYGCLHEWAKLLENEEAADLLEEILDEEKAANDTLTELARSHGNPEALEESESAKTECATSDN